MGFMRHSPRLGGLHPFGDFHHGNPWIDIIQQSVFCHKVLMITFLMARCLQLQLPKVVKNYQTLYQASAIANNLADHTEATEINYTSGQLKKTLNNLKRLTNSANESRGV
jgi:hypothetical protein